MSIDGQCKPTVDVGRLRETERSTSMEAKRYIAVDRVSSKTYFRHLKKINISLSVHYIQNIFIALPLAFSDRKLLLYKPKQPDSFGKNSNFTSHNTGVAGLQLPRLVSLCY